MPRTCVFCASSPLTAELRELARSLGAGIAAVGDDLVYGGTTSGLMGEVAAGARDGGGRVVGVVPEGMHELASVDHRADDLVVTATLGERKLVMAHGTSRFVVLAGGLGTLDELFEVLTMRQLGMLDEAVDVVVLDPTGHFSALRTLLDDLVDSGAAATGNARVRWATTVADALGGRTGDGGPLVDSPTTEGG